MTSAPARIAAAAPLVIPRTGSKGSNVGPAVIRTFFPERIEGVKKASTSSRICAGSRRRPSPTSPQAWLPASGPENRTPSPFRVRTFRTVAGFLHICTFIAGQSISGHSRASKVLETKSSAIPLAAFAMILAVAGATTIRSLFLRREICGSRILGSHISSATGFPLSVSNVSGPTNCAAALVIMTSTSAPAFTSRRRSSQALYAAIPPVTPKRICFP